MTDRIFKTEKEVKAEVKKLLNKHKYFWWMPPANAFGKSGISDFHALHHGVFLAIETKVGTNKPTAMQKGFLQSINAESAFGFVVSDRNLHAFEAWIEAFERSTMDTSRGLKMDDEDGAIMLNAIKAMTEDML